MNRQQKRKFKKRKAREERIRKYSFWKHGYSGLQLTYYTYGILNWMKNK